MVSRHRFRIKQIKKSFDECRDYSSALLLSANPYVTRSRDEHHEYRQNSNYFYLTGDFAPDSHLLITKSSKTPFLFIRKRTAQEIVWDGALPSAKPLAKALGAEIIVTDNLRKEILSKLAGSNHLYYDNAPGTLSWQIAQELMALPSHERGRMPLHFSHCDGVLEESRLYKDPEEIEMIRRANEITNEGLWYVAPQIEAGLSESAIAKTIEYVFRMNGASTSFGTVVASGPSASVLHYRGLKRTMRNGEMLLIDCGAEYQLYAGDITRMMPVGGKFTPEDRAVYEIVLDSQKAALKNIKGGQKIGKAYFAAARVLTEGLVDLKVLRGKVSSLMEKKAYRPYFPHGIGHSLGLDVHDVGRIRGNPDAVLEPGMVVTVEPGLYFAKSTRHVRSCGVRIEDNVLVTKRGCEILSAGFPKEIGEIEQAMLVG